MSPTMILFDCDGVLVDSEVLSVKGMTAVLNEAGIPVTHAMIARYLGMKTADILATLAAEAGIEADPALLPKIWPRTRDIFAAELKPVPGVLDVLKRHPDVKRCVASSSSPERIRASLEFTGLRPYFGEHIFSSSQVERGKPAPDLFLFAAASMGVEPKGCVVVEDSRFGVRGALAAGMTAIGFTGGSHIEPHHADLLWEAGASHVESDWAAVERRIFG